MLLVALFILFVLIIGNTLSSAIFVPSTNLKKKRFDTVSSDHFSRPLNSNLSSKAKSTRPHTKGTLNAVLPVSSTGGKQVQSSSSFPTLVVSPDSSNLQFQDTVRPSNNYGHSKPNSIIETSQSQFDESDDKKETITSVRRNEWDASNSIIFTKEDMIREAISAVRGIASDLFNLSYCVIPWESKSRKQYTLVWMYDGSSKKLDKKMFKDTVGPFIDIVNNTHIKSNADDNIKLTKIYIVNHYNKMLSNDPPLLVCSLILFAKNNSSGSYDLLSAATAAIGSDPGESCLHVNLVASFTKRSSTRDKLKEPAGDCTLLMSILVSQLHNPCFYLENAGSDNAFYCYTKAAEMSSLTAYEFGRHLTEKSNGAVFQEDDIVNSFKSYPDEHKQIIFNQYKSNMIFRHPIQ